MMHATIISQLFCLWQSILLGLFISISYEVIRIIRRIIKHKMIFIHLEDLSFWIIWSIYILMKQINDNSRLRLFHFCGTILGALFVICIYEIVVIPIVNKICLTIQKKLQNRIMRLKK